MKFKSLVVLCTVAFLGLACSKSSGSSADDFDAVAQEIKDDAAILTYFDAHYLHSDGEIWTIGEKEGAAPVENQIPLAELVSVQKVTLKDIEYKLYYLKTADGTGAAPTKVDSVFATYRGSLLDSTIFDSGAGARWFDMLKFLPGWSNGFTNFNAGEVVINLDDSFYFENSGAGWLFFPSGLGYRNKSKGLIPENSPLIFKIELMAVNTSDHDNDGIATKDEDLDKDGNIYNDDTDGDNVPNFADVDDDGDGVRTRNEDINKDGDFTNDDTDEDGIPNYLDNDDDGDGILTINESETNDDDEDGIPDYLDKDPVD
ncbi:MAG: hypothetical protein JKY08_04910 [Flavobacteriaceae bacterium]|nr:hypothetical protein [Flavobacteriaceae bacterium]